jgi:hypothetical protein
MRNFLVSFIALIIVFSHVSHDVSGYYTEVEWNVLLYLFILSFTYCLNSLQLLSVVYFLLPRFKACNLLLTKLDIKTQINYAFGFQFMLQSFSLFTFGIFAIFASFEFFFRKNQEFSEMVLMLIYYNSFDICNFMIFCILSTLMSREIDKSMKLSKKIISKNKKIVNLECLIEEKSTKFNCGLFAFDWKLFATVSSNQT